jgi:thioredoxin 2
MVAPELVRIAASHAGEFLVAKVDTEALPDVAGRLGIQSIPTMALFHRGQELARSTGARPAAAILSFVEQALAQNAR